MGNLTCTASGSVANFYTPYAVPIRSFKVHFSPKQSGSGDPSPTNVRPIEGWTGVTGYRDKKSVVWNQWLKPLTEDDWIARNTDYITVVFENGIATSTWIEKRNSYQASVLSKVGTPQTQEDVLYVSYMINPSLSGFNWGVEFGSGNQVACIINAPANVWQRCSCIRRCRKTGKNYTYISNCYTTPTDDFIGMTAQTKSPILINLTQMFGAGNEPETAEEFEAQCALNGINLDEYQAYDEGTTIGWKTANTDEIPISFPAVGKNLYDEASYPFTDGKWITTGTGNYADDDSCKCTLDFIPFEAYAGLTITLNKRPGGAVRGFAFYSDANRNSFISGEPNNNATAGTPWTLTVPEGTKYMRFTVPVDATDIQIELGSISTEYEVYKGNTFYGGYVDLVSGEVVATHEKQAVAAFDALFDTPNNTTETTIFRATFKDSAQYNVQREAVRLSNTFAYTGNNYNQMQPYTFGGTWGILNYIYFALPNSINTLEDANIWLGNNPTEIAYELKTPVTHTLSPQTLSTLVHSNAFWSNADSVEIEYDLAECGDIKEIRRRILLNTPHLEIVSGSVAHFTTDMASKLKECRVNFLPQQAGSGDPSPSNVRAISGWTGINLYQIGDTGYPIEPIVGSSTSGGMTWTVDENGKVYFDGTPDQFTGVNIGYVDVNGDETLFLRFFGSVNNINTNKATLYDANGNVIITSFTDATIYAGADLSRYDGVKRVRVSAKRAANGIYMHSNFLPIVSAGSPAIPNQITVSWANLGTIYGGFIDVLRGELVKQWELLSKSWGDIRTGRIDETTGLELGVATFTNQVMRCVTRSDYGVNTISNIMGRTLWEGTDVSPEHYYIGRGQTTNKSNAQISLPSTLANDTVIQIAARLETPITYPLSPEIIKAIKGVNNIFSDAGDVEVRFWTH